MYVYGWLCFDVHMQECFSVCVRVSSWPRLLSCAETSVSFMLAQSPGILDEQKALRGMKRR